ncbi:MAG TPA: SLBB domain-containing protein [Candidatus Krumholzibacteria bacterium]|nr:SLBB domain-containing protein [Candidatus Krumholzibacteria bacterium]HRX50736.1 SLBB domain-containing protein [Candidatus Krumholzibacteria bacterium]
MRTRWGWTTLLLLALAGAALAQAPEPYLIGPGDVLQLNVLQQPSLDRELQVRPDGTAVIPTVGEIELAGLSVAAAEQLLAQKLRLYDRNIRDVSVTVVQYNALRIYVMGAVARPGNYTFDAAPTLWSVLREAGGLAPDANPAAVRIISAGEGTPGTTLVDISAFVAGTGTPPGTPLRAGDTVVVPSLSEAAATPEAGVQVFGSVARPGVYPVSEPMPLLSVLMLAGAPIREGDLSKAWWIHRLPSGRYESSLVDMKLFLESGDPIGNPMVHPGDTVRLDYDTPGFWGRAFPIMLGTLTTAATLYLAIDRAQN